ncbi:hypothetical protein V2O64_20550 [Verrucomicrobiaceae bacterium 227]
MNNRLQFTLLSCLTLTANLSMAQVTYHEITSDADSGINAEMTFTHAIDFGTSGLATVNEVVFVNDVNLAAGDRANAGTRTYGPLNHGGNTPPAVSESVASVFQDMVYNGPDPGFVELTGLTPGEFYDLRLYERSWDFQGSTRTYSVGYDIGADGSVEFFTPKLNQNDPTLPTPGFASDISYALSYKYQADASGSIRVIIDLADDQTGTYHLYGLTNAVDPEGSSTYLFSLDNNSFSSGDPQATLIGNLAGALGGNPDPSTFTFVAGAGDTDNDKFQITNNRLEVGNVDFTGANSVDGQQFSVRIQGVGTKTIERTITLTLLKDEDADNLKDAWEMTWAGNLTDLSAALGDEDFDQDGLTNLDEYQVSIGTFNGGNTAYPNIDPTNKDTDNDSLDDGEEIIPTGDRPQTNPTSVDTDSDGLSDAAETNTGVFTDANDTGTDPTNCDTDGDFSIDSWEVTYNSDPSDPNSSPAPVGPVAIVPITDDASTGLDPAKSYTHLISGGQPATVNGVTFETLDTGVTPSNFIWDTKDWLKSIVSNNNGEWDAAASGVSANVEALLASFTYSGNGPNPGGSQRFTLSNLTPGATYDLRIYSRLWGAAGSGRPIEVIFTNGTEIVQPYGNLPLDRPGLLTGSGFNNDAYYLTYQYTAQTADLVIDATVPTCAPGNSGSYHLYALSNELATGAPLGQILVTNQDIQPDGQFIIAFKARPQTTYQVTKSSDLVGDFAPLNIPVSVTTDINGDGQAVIPASEASEPKEFYRIEE